MDIEAQVGEYERPGRRVKEYDFVEAKASYEVALELVAPRTRRDIGDDVCSGKELRGLIGKSSVCTWDNDESDRADRVEFFPQLKRNRNRRMQDESTVT